MRSASGRVSSWKEEGAGGLSTPPAEAPSGEREQGRGLRGSSKRSEIRRDAGYVLLTLQDLDQAEKGSGRGLFHLEEKDSVSELFVRSEGLC